MNSGIIVVGSLNMDLVVSAASFPRSGETIMGESLRQFCGGKGANQAYSAARLGSNVIMLGQVGQDAAGDAQLRNLQSVGVNTRWIATDPSQPSGTAVIVVDARKDNRIIVIPGANGTFAPAVLETMADAFTSAALVLLQLEIPMETVQAAACRARDVGARIILDPAPAMALSDYLIAMADYVTPNISELSALTGATLTEESSENEIAAAARDLCARGARRVMAKLGSRGAMLITPDEQMIWPAHSVNPVDTTAAGDAFNGAFAVELARGVGEREAGLFACAAAALAVTRAGAQASMPTREEVNEFLKRPKNLNDTYKQI